MSLTLDLSDFTPPMERYVQISRRSEADALNKKALDVAYRAAQFTPVATAGSIKSSLLKDPHLLAALTSIHLRSAGVGTLPSPQFKQAMQDFVLSRSGSKKYLRSGWAPVIEALGGSFRGGASARGIHGYATRAHAAGLLAELVWITDQPNDAKRESAEEIAFEALQEAVDFVAKDMAEYIEEQLAKGFN